MLFHVILLISWQTKPYNESRGIHFGIVSIALSLVEEIHVGLICCTKKMQDFNSLVVLLQCWASNLCYLGKIFY